MTSTTRRSLAGAALAVGMLLGAGTATANADMLDSLEDLYGRSASGGQVANLIDDALTLRDRGVPPSPASQQAIQIAMDQRPSLGPLTDALQATVAQQRQTLARASAGGSAPGGGTKAPPWAPSGDDNPMIPGGWGDGMHGYND